jgi:hypothetical protein
LSDLRNAAELLRDVGTDDYVNPPTAEAMQSAANDLDGLAGEFERLREALARIVALDDKADSLTADQHLLEAGRTAAAALTGNEARDA